jgi:hypothetical protein
MARWFSWGEWGTGERWENGGMSASAYYEENRRQSLIADEDRQRPFIIGPISRRHPGEGDLGR